MNNGMIQVHGISKTFKVAERTSGLKAAVKSLIVRKHRTVEALKDISFEIGEGEIVGYIGPNGAGKSTTIKVMSGILVPDAGTCSIMGYTPWKERSQYVRNIGVVFGQRSQLWWDVPVLDSFELLRDIYRIPEPSYKRELDLLSDMLDLGPLLSMPVRQLSLGQRMRCEIAASLLHSPKLLFLDEPTIGLDAVSKLAVRRFIKDINAERAVTVILTTHDMSDIEALANRIIMIGKGTKLYDGSLTELRTRFGRNRILKADFREHHVPVDIEGATRLEWYPERAVYGFDTDQTSMADVIAQLSQNVQLRDVIVESKDIDEMILELYEEHRI